VVLGFGTADWRWKSGRAAGCGAGIDGLRCCCCFFNRRAEVEERRKLLLLHQSGTKKEAEIHGVMVLVLGWLLAVCVREKRKKESTEA
jgi:hypothetical protein